MSVLLEHSYAKPKNLSIAIHNHKNTTEYLRANVLKIDFESIIMGEKLSGIKVNTAQKMLRIQFPTINGLDLTLCPEKDKHIKLYPTNWLQIIFCKGREHWVVATSIGYEIGIVKVYDSLLINWMRKVSIPYSIIYRKIPKSNW